MFANDPAVARRRGDVHPLTHEEPEPGRVEVRARTDDPVLGETAQLPRHVTENVN